MNRSLLLLALGLIAAPLLRAGDTPPMDPMAELGRLRKLAAGLKYQQGEITLPNGIAKISVPKEFRYLDSKDAETVLSGMWHNPPGNGTLGMLVPSDFDPLSSQTWAIDITYANDGYVKDDDAADINYTKMLTDMKAGFVEANKERAKQGYPSIELIGWASPPRYDPATHKLYWAKELSFGGSPVHTLNYNIRILGRSGVLVLNAIAAMPQLATVERAAPSILAMVNFQDGHRYTDFNSSTDKVATYGLAALVAGGIAAKAGLFKVILVGLLAAKKFILMAFLAVSAYLKKLFGRKKQASALAQSSAAEPPAPVAKPASLDIPEAVDQAKPPPPDSPPA